MMPKSFGIFLCLLVATTAFSPSAPSVRTVSSTALSMGWFDTGGKKPASSSAPVAKKQAAKKDDSWIKNMFTPIHGGGSAKESDLDDIYAAQQRILADRRKNFDSKTLKSKYKAVGEDHLRDIDTIAHNPKALNQKEDDAMYFDDDNAAGNLFPWTKKMKP